MRNLNPKQLKIGLLALGSTMALGAQGNTFDPETAQDPLFLSAPVRPLMMLNMSNDHQLFFKLYDDYTDLDEDGQIDTTYDHSYEKLYYGYFDSETCYVYDNGRFEPDSATDNDNYCNAGNADDQWSGNFLNWATMTRMDAVRKILYGGKRSTDTDSATVLERAFLPNDAHSFAKYYNGTDLARLTPFSGVPTGREPEDSDAQESGITICNTTQHDGDEFSQNVDDPPVMRVAEGNFSLWASNERWQCLWQDDIANTSQTGGSNGVNGNDPEDTGIPAASDSPDDDDDALGETDYSVEVLVCADGFREDYCTQYPDGNFKPTGLLQQYGEDGAIQFGLLTGSYGRNRSGGVLRKNIGNMEDEVSVNSDGTFKDQPDDGGIIGTLDRLRLYGYDFDAGLYDGGSESDSCPWGISTFDNGDCSNWGNPQSEIYLESLRYLAGADANDSFESDDSTYIDGLTTADWEDPVDERNYCAPLNVIQFNASTSSYGTELPEVSDIGVSDVAGWVDAIGSAEGINGSSRFIGTTASNDDGLCTPKSVSNLSQVTGTCPDAPRLEGSYNIAGLAYYARNNALRSSPEDTNTVKTYGVALASATPSVTIPVPGQQPGEDEKRVNILPACVNDGPDNNADDGEGNCAIVDFKVIEQDHDGNTHTGSLYVNWEGAEQGSDYDSDLWGIIEYELTSTQVTVTTDVADGTDGSSSRALGFGYVISGTQDDGVHFQSGMNGFALDGTECAERQNGCQDNDPPVSSDPFSIGQSDASLIESPLYYAAKWGGYADDDLTEEEIEDQEQPENYFFATDPRELQESLREAFARVAASVGSASSLAAESTRLEEDSFLYQARFNSEDWSGELQAYETDEVADEPAFTTTEGMEGLNPVTREIYTVNSDSGDQVEFEWNSGPLGNISADQREAFEVDGESAAEARKRFDWIRGDRTNEGAGGLRERSKLLGDIVNSSPVYYAYRDQGNARIDGDAGTEYITFLRDHKQDLDPTLFVGANDGMMHAFYATDESGQALEERFAYVPRGVYDDLANMTRPNYGNNENPHQYTVDGPLVLRDVYMDYQGTNNLTENAKEWRSIIVGTLGAGGKGIYALDVTDPDDPEVIFDYTGEEHDDDLGYIVGEPVIARVGQPPDDKWMVVFGNGYQSNNGEGYLYAIDLDDPSLEDADKVQISDSTGLSAPALLPDGDNIVYRAYAGDLMGNMWRLDADDSGDWSLGLNDDPLFTARDADNDVDAQRQPITSRPALGINNEKDGAIMVYFGTGKYLDRSDNEIDHTNSFYAIADTGDPVDVGTGGNYDRSSELHEKSLDMDTDTGERSVENDYDTDWSEDSGWYLDFDSTTGERLVQTPALLFDRLLFPTIQPSAIPCEYGGTSWLMELVAVGDRFVGEQLLDEFVEVPSMVLGNPLVTSTGSDGGFALLNTTDPTLAEDDSGDDGDGDGGDGDNGDGGDGGGNGPPRSPRCEEMGIPPAQCPPLEWPYPGLGRQSWNQLQ